jgi:iron complex transport system substrate-binding protein
MKKMLAYILAVVLLASAVLSAVTPASATGISSEYKKLFDSDNQITRGEIASAVCSYMLGGGALQIEELRDAAHVYAYWNGEPRAIVDTAKRPVTIYKPVKKIVVLSSDSARAVQIFGDEDKVVGITDTVKKFPFYFPEMSQKPVVGTWKEVDWEEIPLLEPDLVIAYATGTINAKLAAEKLEPFGITVVGLYLYVTGEYEQILDELEKLGVLLEREEEAERYIEWHDKYEARVEAFIEGKEKPKVFMTYTAGAIGMKDKSKVKSYGKGSLDYLLGEKAGGKLITENYTGTPELEVEWVRQQNPDIVIMKCGNVFGGWDTTETPADLIQQLLDGNPLWGEMNATVNNTIYAVPWSISNGFEHIYGVVLLTKIFYPEFEIDPADVYKEFIRDFLRVEYREAEWKVLVYPPLGG